ncbi:MAG: NTP transferase domain-containing protein [Patescibacteria group bacterium]|nr:NTP transferase domain-containing protein [Patescibacteria group bacterium]
MNQVIILAAGKGTRMNSELPKVLVPLNGEPMIKRLLREVVASGVCDRPIIVVSPDNQEMIRQALSEFDCDYAIQDEQLGTGHAFSCARESVEEEVKNLIGLYGDHPFITKETIRNLVKAHQGELTMMTVNLPDFEDWRENFRHWGRIVRDEAGEIIEIKEFKDASEETKKITEVNPGLFCFRKSWLWDNIDKLRNNNKQSEYYLTDMVKIAFESGLEIESLPIEAHEAMGINSREELAIAEKILEEK